MTAYPSIHEQEGVERLTMARADQVDISGMSLFVSIVEEGSISAAARALAMPKATLSRRLSEMERQAGVPLLARSTRSLALTDAGRRHYERVHDLVHDARAAQAELRAGSDEPSGIFRVSASMTYGGLVIAPRVAAFAARHTALQIELDLRDEPVNVIADHYDLAVRMGEVADTELMSRRIAELEVVLVASPRYLARASLPETADALARHDIVVTPADVTRWRIDGRDVPLRRRFASSAVSAARLAVMADLGIARLPLFAVAPDLASGDLVRVMPHADLPRFPATALFPRSVAPSAALRLLLRELTTSPP